MVVDRPHVREGGTTGAAAGAGSAGGCGLGKERLEDVEARHHPHHRREGHQGPRGQPPPTLHLTISGTAAAARGAPSGGGRPFGRAQEAR
jgi:hypothetical protein